MRKFCMCKQNFFLKTLSVTFYPSRKFILTKYLQKYDLSIQSVLFDWTFKKIFLLLNVNENCLQVQTRIITLDHFHSSLYRKQLFWNQVKFRKHVKISCLKWTIVVKENLQRVKFVTFFKHTELGAVFRTQLNIYEGTFLRN